MRRTVVGTLTALAALAGLALSPAASAAAFELQVDRGIVQSVSRSELVLRELDGRTVALAVGASTRVRVNGLPATLADVLPGFVAAVSHDGGAPALSVRAFGRIARVVHRGVVVSASRRSFVLRADSGETLTFQRALRTRVLWRGAPARWSAVRPGRAAEVTHTTSGVALRVVLRPRRAA